MGGLLHPVGPEEERTYWVRRGVVGGVLLLLLVMFFSAIGSLGNASGVEARPAGQPAGPAPAPVDVPASKPTPSAPDNMSSGTADDPDPDATPTATPTPTPTPGPSAAPPAAPAAPKATPTPTPTPKAAATPQATPKGAPVESKAPVCNPKDLKVLIAGPRDAKAAQPVGFHFSVTNTSQQACLAEVNPATFQLLITSGPARVWSSADCPAKFESKRAELAAGGVFEWDTAWTGEMSSPNCEIAKQQPRPGTYVAHAMVKDAKEASSRILLK